MSPKTFALLAAALLILVGFAAVPTVAVVSSARPPPAEAPAPATAAFDLGFAAWFTASSSEEGVLVWGAFAVAVEISAVAVNLPADSAPPPTPSIPAVLSFSVLHERDPETLYVFLNSLRLAKIDSTTTNDYAFDALTNVRVGMSSSGARLNTLAYRPFRICAYGCG